MEAEKRLLMNHRSGFSLFECVLVVAVVALIGTLSARLLHAMMRQQTVATQQLVMSSSLARMQDRFQRDVNLAVRASVSPNAIVLRYPDNVEVSWVRDAAFIVRNWRADGEVRREYFDVLAALEHTFTKSSIGTTQLIVMEFHANPAKRRDQRFVTLVHGARISAELGRDHRWDGHMIGEERE